ncbi:MAG: hypothetical protein SOX77_00100, partial [Candidatus Borkfalkiaceae bacterium]|nr:hypothetical protein [Christensenellaceae bacterium]
RKNCLIGARNADVCTVCGKEINVVPAEVDGEAKEHTIVKVTYLLDEAHRGDPCVCEAKTVVANVCSVCHETLEVLEETPAPGHQFGDWTIVREPGDDTEGLLVRRCTVCSNAHIDDEAPSVYKVIPAIYVLDKDGEATNEVNSYYTYVRGTDAPSCSIYGRMDSYEFFDPNGGVHEIKCNVRTRHLLVLDGKNVEIDTSKVLVLDETYGDKVQYVSSRLTCDRAGVQGFFNCDECGKNIEVKVRSEHVAFSEDLQTEEDKAKSVAPTCLTKGVNYYHCSGCGSEVCVTVPAVGHDVVCTKFHEPTDNNSYWVFDLMCRTCNEALESVVSKKAPTIKEVAATCTENAYIVYTDIVIGKNTDGTDKILLDDDGNPVEIRKEKEGTALGHHNAVLDAVVADDDLFDLRDEKNAAAFQVIGTVNCLTAGPEKAPMVGFYKCDRCGTNRPVKVFVSHKGETKTTKYATCTEKGEFTIVKCDDCKQENKTVEIPALGHNKVYTITETDNNIVVTWKCVRLNKAIVADPTEADPDHTKFVETPCDATGTVQKTVKSYVIIIKSTCKDNGKARLTYVDGSTEDVTLATSGHILNGEVIVCAYDHTYSPDKEGINYTGLAPTCKDFVEDDAANGFFKCDVCAKWQPVYVKTEHKKPASFDPTDITQHKDPTCTEDGYDIYVCAGDCGETQHDVIKALGHDVVYGDIDLEDFTFTVSCKREGCALNGDENVLIVQLPFAAGIFDSIDGKIVVDAEAAAVAGYTVTTVVEGTCTNKGTYKLALTKAAYKEALKAALIREGHDAGEVANFDLDHKVEVEISLRAEHNTIGSTIVWVNDGYRYTGRYCNVCGNVFIISAVKIGW